MSQVLLQAAGRARSVMLLSRCSLSQQDVSLGGCEAVVEICILIFFPLGLGKSLVQNKGATDT